jgi:hypothetical protein
VRKPVCHAGNVPSVASLDALRRAAAEFSVTDPGLVIEPAALAAARRSLDSSGLLLILFDGVIGADWSWSQRDEAMARRILAASPAGARTLAVAGNAHTPTSPIQLGIPMGARLAERRPGMSTGDPDRVRRGYYWNFEPRQFARHTDTQGHIRLH